MFTINNLLIYIYEWLQSFLFQCKALKAILIDFDILTLYVSGQFATDTISLFWTLTSIYKMYFILFILFFRFFVYMVVYTKKPALALAKSFVVNFLITAFQAISFFAFYSIYANAKGLNVILS